MSWIIIRLTFVVILIGIAAVSLCWIWMMSKGAWEVYRVYRQERANNPRRILEKL